MSIYRDLGLPWVPDRLGSGDVRDLEPTDNAPLRPKPAMGFTPPSKPISSIEQVDLPCGWCADCLGLHG